MSTSIPKYLTRIVDTKRAEISQLRSQESEESLKYLISQKTIHHRGFAAALRQNGLQLIAEVKKASPSKGVIRDDFDPVAIACEFESAGAAALSVLTDQAYFMGNLNYLEAIREAVSLPILRKDFILDPIQILESKLAGADAILLIMAILSEYDAKALHAYAQLNGLEVLVEVHTQAELDSALRIPGIQMIGINNRNLDTFEVSLDTGFQLIPENRADTIWVSESGYESRFQLELAQSNGFDAVLIGEGLARHPQLIDFFK